MSNNVRITADFQDKGVSAGIKKIGTESQTASTHVGKFGSVLQGIGQGIGQAAFGVVEKGITAVEDALKGATAAYQDAQVSTVKMDTALKNSVASYNGNDDAINKVIEAGTALGFSADSQRDSLSALVVVTKDTAAAQSDMSLAMDVARARGIDLATATTIVMKAQEGNTGALKKLGIVVPPVTTAMDKLTASHKKATPEQIAVAKAADKQATSLAALKAISVSYSGQAAKYANTDAGKEAAAHEKVQEALVKVGKITSQISTVVMPILADAFGNIVDAVSPLLDQLSQQMPAIMATAGQMFDTLRGAVTGVANAIMPLIQQVIPPMLSFIQSINSDGDKMAAVLGIIGGVVLAIVVPPFVAWAAATLAATWPIIAVIAGVAALIVVLDKLGILKTIGAVMKDLAAKVLPALSTAFDFISKTVMPAVQKAIQFVTDTVIPALSAAFKTAGDIIGTVWSAISTAVKTAINIVIGAIDAIIRGINSIQLHIDLKPPIGPELKFDYNGPNISTIPTLHAGGIVPGPAGANVPIMAQAGERISPMSQSGSDGGGHTFNFYNPAPEPPSVSMAHANLMLAASGRFGN